MSVALVGTSGVLPSLGTGSVTPAWGTGQTRAAGNLLTCVGGGYGTNPLSCSVGWTKGFTTDIVTGSVRINYWWKIAAGGDAAPTISQTSGTNMCGELNEWSGAAADPFDTHGSAVVTSGTSLSPQTARVVTDANGVALAWFFRYLTSSTTMTWTPGGSFSNLRNDGATSRRYHYSADRWLNPTAGSACTDAETVSGGTTSRWAGLVVVFKPAGVVSSSLGLSYRIAGPIALVGVPQGVQSATRSATVSVPAGVADGDFLLASITGYGSAGAAPGAPSNPAGWTPIDPQSITADPGHGSTASTLYYRWASSEPASYVFSVTGGDSYVDADITAYRWVNPVTPYIGEAGTKAVSSTATSADSGSTVLDNSWHVLKFSLFDTTNDVPAGYTEDLAYDGTPEAHHVYHKVITPAGATGAKSVSLSDGDAWVAFSLVLQPIGSATSTVSSALDLSWTIWNTVASARALSYRIRALVSSARGLSWRILALGTAARSLSYRILAYATSARSLSWAIAGTVSSARALSWSIHESVGIGRQLSWRILASAATARALSWRLLEVTSSSQGATWRLRGAVSAARTLSWRIVGLVSSARALAWRIDAGGTAAAVLDLAWRIVAVVGSPRGLSWRVRAAAASPRGLAWRLLAQAQSSIVPAWRILAAVSSSRSLSWVISGPVARALALAWRLLAAVRGRRLLAWRLRNYRDIDVVLWPPVVGCRLELGELTYMEAPELGVEAYELTAVEIGAPGAGCELEVPEV